MNICFHCGEEKNGVTHLKSFQKEVGICLECRSIMFEITKREFNTIEYFKFVDKIKMNYESLKKIKR